MSPFLVGAALGATSAFILDPQEGRRRRAQGIAVHARSLRGESVTDDVLCARVRSKIGRYTTHPRAIEVTAFGGRVVLTGDVLQRELDRLVDAARAAPGVQHVENELRVHETAEHVSALQGTGTGPHGEPWEVLEQTWTPGVRAIVGGGGAASLLYSLVRGGFGALVPLAIGTTLLACAVNAGPRQK
jgi:hypothetical protein